MDLDSTIERVKTLSERERRRKPSSRRLHTYDTCANKNTYFFSKTGEFILKKNTHRHYFKRTIKLYEQLNTIIYIYIYI